MRLIGVISTALLSLTLGAAAPAYAQQEQHDQQEEQKAKPAQDEKKAQPAKPATQERKSAPQQEKNAEQEKPAPQHENNAKQEKPAQQQDQNTKQEEKSAQQQQQRTQQAKPEQQAQRAGGNGGGRIPDERYRANFGQEHTFRVTEGDYSNHRFQYGGYWFGFVDPWPSNWLYTQNLYIIDIDGVYYLCNPMYPGMNIALNVTL